jgi:glycosyltransferase involved in cell wall biosynthesis
VIAAAIGGLGELVRHGETGLLVAPGEVAPLARAIVELASDLPRAARMGEAGRRRALTSFLEDRCTDRTEILYRAALAVDGSDPDGARANGNGRRRRTHP